MLDRARSTMPKSPSSAASALFVAGARFILVREPYCNSRTLRARETPGPCSSTLFVGKSLRAIN
jgi:hypothetical protein